MLRDKRLADDLASLCHRDELVVEFGAGRGALTIPLAQRGARVIAVEHDPVWADADVGPVVGVRAGAACSQALLSADPAGRRRVALNHKANAPDPVSLNGPGIRRFRALEVAASARECVVSQLTDRLTTHSAGQRVCYRFSAATSGRTRGSA